MEVKLHDKKAFIQEFLRTKELTKTVSRMILLYLCERDWLLKKCRFVDSIQDAENGMLMTTTDIADDFPSFFGVFDSKTTTDVDKFYRNLKYVTSDDQIEIFIHLEFPNKMEDELFMKVLEENPRSRVKLTKQEKKMVNDFVHHIALSSIKRNYMLLIDDALQSGDKERFMRLSNDFINYLQNEKKEKGTTA